MADPTDSRANVECRIEDENEMFTWYCRLQKSLRQKGLKGLQDKRVNGYVVWQSVIGMKTGHRASSDVREHS